MADGCMTQRMMTPAEETWMVGKMLQSIKDEPRSWEFDGGYAVYKESLWVFIGHGWAERHSFWVRVKASRFIPDIYIRSMWKRRKLYRALHKLRHNYPETAPSYRAIKAAIEEPAPETTVVETAELAVEPIAVPVQVKDEYPAVIDMRDRLRETVAAE